MANVLFTRTNDNTQEPIIDGQVVFETKSNGSSLYLDDGTERKKVSGGCIDDPTTKENGNYLMYNGTEWIAKGFELTKTLVKGSTSLVISSSKLNTNSTVDFYTSVYGVNPITAILSDGSITMTFDEQEEDVTVKVVVR